MINYPSMDKEIFLPAEQFFEQTKPTGLTFDDISYDEVFRCVAE